MKTFSGVLCFSLFFTITMPSLIESPLLRRYFDKALQQQAMPEFLVKLVPDEN